MTEPYTWLVVDDDEAFATVLARSLNRRGETALVATHGEQAKEVLCNHPVQRIVLDLKIADESGLQLLPELLALAPTAEIVVLTGFSSIPTTVEAMKLGARNYLAKPASTEEIIAAFEEDAGDPETPIAPTPLSLERMEWEYIQRALQENAGNITKTAEQLGLHRRTLQRKLQKKPARN